VKHETTDGSNEEAAEKSPGKDLRGGKKGSPPGSHGFILLLVCGMTAQDSGLLVRARPVLRR
jgi:hypothetical protein